MCRLWPMPRPACCPGARAARWCLGLATAPSSCGTLPARNLCRSWRATSTRWVLGGAWGSRLGGRWRHGRGMQGSERPPPHGAGVGSQLMLLLQRGAPSRARPSRPAGQLRAGDPRGRRRVCVPRQNHPGVEGRAVHRDAGGPRGGGAVPGAAAQRRPAVGLRRLHHPRVEWRQVHGHHRSALGLCAVRDGWLRWWSRHMWGRQGRRFCGAEGRRGEEGGRRRCWHGGRSYRQCVCKHSIKLQAPTRGCPLLSSCPPPCRSSHPCSGLALLPNVGVVSASHDQTLKAGHGSGREIVCLPAAGRSLGRWPGGALPRVASFLLHALGVSTV